VSILRIKTIRIKLIHNGLGESNSKAVEEA
jgi:hypothetical protein